MSFYKAYFARGSYRRSSCGKKKELAQRSVSLLTTATQSPAERSTWKRQNSCFVSSGCKQGTQTTGQGWAVSLEGQRNPPELQRPGPRLRYKTNQGWKWLKGKSLSSYSSSVPNLLHSLYEKILHFSAWQEPLKQVSKLMFRKQVVDSKL